MTVAIPSHTFPLGLGLWGVTQAAPPTERGVAFRHSPAHGANGHETLGGSSDLSSVLDRVAILAERYPVADVKAKFRVVPPTLDVMCLNITSVSASLAFVVIALVNSSNPTLVTIASSLISVGLSGRFIAAVLGAILLFMATTNKQCAAMLAGQPFSIIQGAGALGRAGSARGSVASDELASADGAGNGSARIAMVLPAVYGFKRFVAAFALDDCGSKSSHAHIIPYLERTATAFPGIEIERLD